MSASARSDQPQNAYAIWRKNLERNLKPNQSILKKQVTFKSPTENLNRIGIVSEMNRCDANKIAGSNASLLPEEVRSKHFQHIYMANIPSRCLDLSLVDFENPKTTPQNPDINQNVDLEDPSLIIEKQTEKVPTTYKEFLEMQKCKMQENSMRSNDKVDIITDIFNYNSPRKSNEILENQSTRSCTKTITNSKRNFNDPVLMKRTSQNINNKENSGMKPTSPPKSSDMLCKCTMSETNFVHNHSHGKDLNYKPIERNYLTNLQPHFIREDPIPNPVSYKTDTNNRKTNMYHDRVDLNHPEGANCIPYKNGNALYPDYTLDVFDKSSRQRLADKSDSSCQTSIVCSSVNNTEKHSTDVVKADDVTVKDLLKIIQQQNEQLLILQKQIASLLDRKEYPKQIEDCHQRTNVNKSKCLTNVDQGEFFNNVGSTPRKRPLSKFSIDLMTSFEVSIRPQQNKFQRNQRDLVSNEPKIQEITETDSMNEGFGDQYRREIVDSSLHLEGPITLRENIPSPEPSINIDMKEYESSEDDDDDLASKIGVTFYNEMMKQVNKIIQNSQRQTNNSKDEINCDYLNDKASKRAKDVVRNLRKMGTNFSTIDEVSSSNNTEKNDNIPEHVSFAVKQLLMKYLPNDRLTKMTDPQPRIQSKKNTEDKIVITSRTPEFSIATVEFMKKYNLISGNANVPPRSALPNKVSSNPLRKGNNPKILDISVLKQQPKLL